MGDSVHPAPISLNRARDVHRLLGDRACRHAAWERGPWARREVEGTRVRSLRGPHSRENRLDAQPKTPDPIAWTRAHGLPSPADPFEDDLRFRLRLGPAYELPVGEHQHLCQAKVDRPPHMRSRRKADSAERKARP